MGKNSATIDLKLSGIREVRQELKTLQFDLSQATDPEQMAELSKRAGELRDNLNRANEQARVFAAGSPFEQTNNALGLMGSQIMSLDFEGAAESAKLFASAAKGINPSLMATQLKSLGSIVLTVSKAFVTMGAALLVNPIFLIAAAIIGIVTIIGVLLNKLGLLKPILDVIGKAFGYLMDAIDLVVESIKEFLDWIGLTDFAGDELAANQIERNDKLIESIKKVSAETTDTLDHEIRLRQIAGEDTAKLERKKLEMIKASLKQQVILAGEKAMAIIKLHGEDSEEYKAQKEALDLLVSEFKKSKQEIEIFEATQVSKEKETLEKTEAEKAAIRKEAYEKYKANRIAEMEEEAKRERDHQQFLLDLEQWRKEDLEKRKQQAAEELQLEQYMNDSIESFMQQQLDKEEADYDKRLEQQKAFNDATLEADRALADAKLGAAMGLVSALGSLAGENKKIANAIFAVDKALAIAEIVVSTQREIAGYASNPTWSLLPDGGAAIKAGYISAAKIRAGVGIATIAAASIAKFMNGSGGGSVGGSGGGGGSASSSQPMQPSFNLFGQSNVGNNASSSQSVEGSQSMTVIAKVSAVDMTAEQESNKKNMEMATL